jgi:hypothetical protein
MVRRSSTGNQETRGNRDLRYTSLVLAAGLTAFLGLRCINTCENQTKLTPSNIVQPQNLESMISSEKDPVVIGTEELASYRRIYLADGVITPEEVYNMADNLFREHAYNFDIKDPDFVPMENEYNVVENSFRECDEGLEADIYWKNTGRTYTLSVPYDLKSATLYEN